MGLKSKVNDLTETIGELVEVVEKGTQQQSRLIDIIAQSMASKGISDATAIKVEFNDGTAQTFVGDRDPALNQRIDPSRVKEVVPVTTAKAGVC